MDEIIRFKEEYVRFVPSHLTKALLASVVSLGFAAYAAWEFSQVEMEEVEGLIGRLEHGVFS